MIAARERVAQIVRSSIATCDTIDLEEFVRSTGSRTSRERKWYDRRTSGPQCVPLRSQPRFSNPSPNTLSKVEPRFSIAFGWKPKSDWLLKKEVATLVAVESNNRLGISQISSIASEKERRPLMIDGSRAAMHKLENVNEGVKLKAIINETKARSLEDRRAQAATVRARFGARQMQKSSSVMQTPCSRRANSSPLSGPYRRMKSPLGQKHN